MDKIRLYFESKPSVSINDEATFRRLLEREMNSFGFNFGGYIMMDAMKKIYHKLEPVWQYISHDSNYITYQSVCDWLKKNKPAGYIVHCKYEKRPNNCIETQVIN